jgi:hypothetical protein
MLVVGGFAAPVTVGYLAGAATPLGSGGVVLPSADASLPTGGPLRLTVEDLREVVAALDAADAELVADFGLRDAAFESDPFLAAEEYVRSVERFVRDVWTMLAFFDPECDRAEVDEGEPW